MRGIGPRFPIHLHCPDPNRLTVVLISSSLQKKVNAGSNKNGCLSIYMLDEQKDVHILY